MTVSSVEGLSLVEMLVALALGLLVMAGITTAFLSGMSAYRMQTQLGQLQEEGRFALNTIAADLRAANGLYCNAVGGGAEQASDGTYIERLRSPTIHARHLNTDAHLPFNSTPWGTPYPVPPDEPYAMPSFLFMRGHDCGLGGCMPASLPSRLGRQRVGGTDVLTMRYLDVRLGWPVADDGDVVADADGNISYIRIVPAPGDNGFVDGDLFMLAHCMGAQVFAARGSGGKLYPDPGANHGRPRMPGRGGDTRLFNLTRHLRTVTYYVERKSSDDIGLAAYAVGALMRCEARCEEIARGIERLDFRYAVENADAGTQYLTADEVDTRAGGRIACPKGPSGAPVPDTGCLWRAIKSVEVSMVVSGQRPAHSLSGAERAFTYIVDGIEQPSVPDRRGAKGIAPAQQGFPEAVLRREFGSVVSLRNYNP
jgi:type IV pilus assembly protein PilW